MAWFLGLTVGEFRSSRSARLSRATETQFLSRRPSADPPYFGHIRIPSSKPDATVLRQLLAAGSSARIRSSVHLVVSDVPYQSTTKRPSSGRALPPWTRCARRSPPRARETDDLPLSAARQFIARPQLADLATLIAPARRTRLARFSLLSSFGRWWPLWSREAPPASVVLAVGAEGRADERLDPAS